MWCSLLLSRLRAGTHYTRLRRSALTQALFWTAKKEYKTHHVHVDVYIFPPDWDFLLLTAQHHGRTRCVAGSRIMYPCMDRLIFSIRLSLWLNVESTSLDSLVAIVNNSGREQEAPPRQNLINYWICFWALAFGSTLYRYRATCERRGSNIDHSWDLMRVKRAESG